jgi:hypothetical protein
MNKTKKYLLTLAVVLSGTIQLSANPNLTNEQNSALKDTIHSLTRAIRTLKKGSAINDPDVIKSRRLMQQTLDNLKGLYATDDSSEEPNEL